MAIILIKTESTVGKGINSYIAETTDAESAYPTNCGPGSMMEIVDKANKKVTEYKVFDGEQWNTI